MSKKHIEKTNNKLNTLNTNNISCQNENLNEYIGFTKRISESQDLNTKEMFKILEQAMNLTKPSEEYNQCLQQVLKDHSKILDGELTFEQKKEIINSEIEILNTATERENERIENNKEIVKVASNKDTEKSEINWSLLKNVSFILIATVTSAVGGFIGGKHIGKK